MRRPSTEMLFSSASPWGRRLGVSKSFRKPLRAAAWIAGALVGLQLLAADAALSQRFTHTIETRGDVAADRETFARIAAETLGDIRGWTLNHNVRYDEVSSAGSFRLILASPAAVDRAAGYCSPRWSCRVGDQVLINDRRWRLTTPTWPRSRRDYRQYVINHEVGHWLGLGHPSCPGAGASAPVMMQQSQGLDGCVARVWPKYWERAEVARIQGITGWPTPAPDAPYTIEGTSGADTLEGTGHADVICGHGGDDVIRGGGGFDLLRGHSGNDELRGQRGIDVVVGGPGNDFLAGGAGADTLRGATGDDVLTGRGSDDRMIGGPGADRLHGVGGDDFLRGRAGPDVLRGHRHRDELRGGGGSDDLYSGSAADLIRGGGEGDRLFGRAGDDRLFGRPGDDWLVGNAGDDLLDGGRGDDRCNPGPGENTVRNCN